MLDWKCSRFFPFHLDADLRGEDWHTFFATVCNAVLYAVHLLSLHAVVLLEGINHIMGESVVQWVYQVHTCFRLCTL